MANENYYIVRGDYTVSDKDSLNGTYFFDSGPQTQGDPLGNVVHKVYSRRWLASGEETHVFGNGLVNTAHGGLSRVLGDINTPVSGDSVATDSKLAIAPDRSLPRKSRSPGSPLLMAWAASTASIMPIVRPRRMMTFLLPTASTPSPLDFLLNAFATTCSKYSARTAA